jgi:hypothetical protein
MSAAWLRPRRIATDNALSTLLIAIDPVFSSPSERRDVAGQFEDGLPQPAVLRFENGKETDRPTLWFSVILFMQFPIRCL